MNVIDIAVQNKHIAAKAKLKASRTRARKTDNTTAARAAAANIRDQTEKLWASQKQSKRHVRFVEPTPAAQNSHKPAQSLLRRIILRCAGH